MESLESSISSHNSPAGYQLPLQLLVVGGALYQLLLVLEVGVPLAGDDGVRHDLIDTLVLGQQRAVAASLLLVLSRNSCY